MMLSQGKVLFKVSVNLITKTIWIQVEKVHSNHSIVEMLLNRSDILRQVRMLIKIILIPID